MILLTPKINNMEQKLTYEQFIAQAMLHDLTEIVKLLLKNRIINLDECIFNERDVITCLPDGKVTIPSSHYYDQIDKNSVTRQELLNKKEELQARNEDVTMIQTKLEQMNNFFIEFEKAPRIDRRIHEWRLIPHWLADRLLGKGETVLRAYGCNWWGVKEIQPTGVSNHEVLKVIYNEL
jgi:hypothetical protein